MIKHSHSLEDEHDSPMNPVSSLSNNDKCTTPGFLIKAVAAASLGGILFGYDMGVVSGALPQLKQNFTLNDAQEETVVSFLYLGCCIGSALGGTLCDSVGRRKSILLTDIIFVIGAILLWESSSIPQLLIGRIVVGIAVAVSGIADVAYLHEISPSIWRGSIISVNEGCISLGFMLSYLSGYGISMISPNQGWRYMFGIGAIIAIMQFISMIFMPESPVWLQENGFITAAEQARNIIKHDTSPSPTIGTTHSFNGETIEFASQHSSVLSSDPGSVETDIVYGSVDHKQQQNPQQQYTPPTPLTTDSLSSILVMYRKQVVITLFLAIIQQFCGHPNVLNFAPEIFIQIGYTSSKSSLRGTFLIGVVKFIAACIVIVNIERIGRRVLLLLGIGMICMGNLFVTLSLWKGSTSLDLTISLWEKVIAVVGIFLVAIGYAVSFGPLTWLIVSEIFPPSIRGRALGASLLVTYIALFLVSYTFLSGQKLGKAIPFLCYFLVTLLSMVFVYLAIPDTGRKSPEEIEGTMTQMRFWKKSTRSLNFFTTVPTTAIV